jgi:hypothetical protein
MILYLPSPSLGLSAISFLFRFFLVFNAIIFRRVFPWRGLLNPPLHSNLVYSMHSLSSSLLKRDWEGGEFSFNNPFP